MAVLEKGKAPGSHLLSGAVIDPEPLRRLVSEAFPSYGVVPGESVLFLTSGHSVPLPIPPTMRNHGNVIVSLSQLGRWLAETAEGLGVAVLPETTAEKLLLSRNEVVGVRTGDKGRGRAGEGLPRFEPGSGRPRPGDDPGGGHGGAFDDGRAVSVRARRVEPADVGARCEGGLEGRAAFGRGHPHDGVAASAGGEVPRVRGVVRLPDGRGDAHDRDGRRARLP